MQRRSFLAATGGIAGILSGCTELGDDDEVRDDTDNIPEDIPSPEVNHEDIDDWELFDEDEMRYDDEMWVFDVTGYARTRYYENQKLRERVIEKTAGAFDEQVATLAATRIELEGFITRFADSEDLIEAVEPDFVEQLEAYGVENLEESDTEENIRPLPDSAEIIEYEGEISVPGYTEQVQMSEDDSYDIELDSGTLSVTGLGAAWFEDDTGYFGAGVFPAEPYSNSDTISLTGEKDEGIDVDISVSLFTDSQTIRTDIKHLIASIE